MIFPLGSERHKKRPTKVTLWLMGVNIVVAMVFKLMEHFSPELFATLYGVDYGDPEQGVLLLGMGALHPFEPWALITSQFLHGSFLHLAGNMLFLWAFGPDVEDRIGRWGFLVLYLAGGVVAGGAHLLFAGENYPGWGYVVPPALGASGAVAAVTGLYLVLFPKINLRCFSILYFRVIAFPAWMFIAIAVVIDLVYLAGGDQGVAREAHLGGYAFGAAAAFVLLKFRLIKREPYDLFTMGRQAHRRRQFKELVTKGRHPWEDAPKEAPRLSSTRRSPDSVAISTMVGEVTGLVGEGAMARACERYRELLGAHGRIALPRDAQLGIATHCLEAGEPSRAAEALEIFIEKYPGDGEVPATHLMLALLNLRQLNDPITAEKHLKALNEDSLDPAQQALVRELRAEI